MSGRADFSRERNGGGAAAAPHIDNPFAGRGLGAIDQNVGDRREQSVLHLLAFGPVLAPRPVPVRNLIRIQVVACRYIHRALIGFGALRRSSLRSGLGGAFAADVAPGVSRALIRNVTERSLVGPLGFPFGLDLLWRLFLVSIAVLGNGLALGVSRPRQERDYGCRGENSHA